MDIEFKTEEGRNLYKMIKRIDDETELKKKVLNYFVDHRNKARDEFRKSASVL